MKTVKEASVGEMLYDPVAQNAESIKPFAGFRAIRPTIYAGLFPVDLLDYEDLKRAVERLCLNDSSVTIESITSPALGGGWRVGFLGALHMEVNNEILKWSEILFRFRNYFCFI